MRWTPSSTLGPARREAAASTWGLARADLLRVLTSPSNVRADVIRQFHERVDGGMVEVLSDLEVDELLRLHVIDALRRLGQE